MFYFIAFFKEDLKIFFILLFGCVGSQLWHVGSSLWHAGSFVVACRLFIVACELL